MAPRRNTPPTIEMDGKLYKFYGKNKAKKEVCARHERILTMCPDPECGGGRDICKHKIQRSYCPDPQCGGGSRCKHKLKRTLCPDPECGGGGALCKHKISRCTCKDKECNPHGAMYCKHGIQRTVCRKPECEGGGSICEHDKERRDCMVCSPHTALARTQNRRIASALKAYRDKKSNRTLEYLGCDAEFFVVWIEMQMEPWMTWENYGSRWHIDHKVPICYEKADCTKEELLRRLRYSNCQPLCAKENMQKKANYCS